MKPLKLFGFYAALMVAGAAVAVAQSQPDPMRQMRGDTIVEVSVRLDPMEALRAPPLTETSEVALSDEFGGLPDAPGAEETYYTCVACHSTDIIKQQRVSDARWDDLWQWMIETQGMIEPDDADREIILAYLKTHFSSER
ncbi:MAG: cytochrome C-552 [Paracoccus sp. (in: a-proteobacteria)]|nr:cytochrome C-552 [Paracoccus sp. (in: a-proteobacteria)]